MQADRSPSGRQERVSARFWVEFADPGRDDDEVLVRADLTWLTSNWHCLYGIGCPGIVAGRPDDGCCTFGAHFTDAQDRDRVVAAAMQLRPAQWQHRPAGLEADSLPAALILEPAADPGATDDEGMTALVDGACIFLNRPGFPGGAGCALHQLALATGRSIVATKPEVCWQVPIRRYYEQRTTPDEVTRQVVCIGEFDRAAWGPGGHDLDWYCTADPQALAGPAPLYRSAEAELVELMGRPAYNQLVELAEQFLQGSASPASPDGH